MATTKTTPSAREALSAVRQAAATLTGQLRAERQRRQELETELNHLLNQPLSKTALVQLLARAVDKMAATHVGDFQRAVLSGLTVDRYARVRSQLVLADVPVMFADPRGPVREAQAGGFQHSANSLVNVFGGTAPAHCYYLGDAIKASLPQLLEGMAMPYMDDGKSLEEREAEVSAVLEKIEQCEQRMGSIQGELTELADVVPPEPEVPVPPPEPKPAWTWSLEQGLQPGERSDTGKMQTYVPGVPWATETPDD
ncbi:hypothetical protein [Ottowia testudinis]|uniref:Uncharacterized protein n=1 Tax=Ottowia testudinis TaxID=2816950 RepID=A0A975CGS5_9BURK|nr:hypothetical protein [Ottowia testudinis]QTD46163.1 hypothetical protein J1M35_04455 [Ottowia testudinis]